MQLPSSSRLILAIGILGVGLSLGASHVLSNLYIEQQRALFSKNANDAFYSISNVFDQSFQRLSALGLYLDVQPQLTLAKFEGFAGRLVTGAKGIQALEWIPRVPKARKKTFESIAGFSGMSGYRIWQRDTDGKQVPVTERDVYYPVYFAEPLGPNLNALGFDLASNPVRRAALLSAQETGKMVISGRIQLVQDETHQFGFLAFRPVYRRDKPSETKQQRLQAITGFALAVYRITDLINQALPRAAKNSVISFDIHDDKAPPATSMLYASDNENSSTQPSQGRDEKIIHKISVGGRAWSITFWPTLDHPIYQPSFLSRTALFAGLVITGLLAAMMNFFASRERFAARLVAERTEELRNLADNYKEQKELAEVSVRSKSEFLAAMSHEIRTPMAGVMGFADMLLDGDLSSAEREMVGKIKSATQSLLIIINDILDLSRLDSNKFDLEFLDFHLTSELEDIFHLFDDSAQEKGILLSMIISPDVPDGIRSDPTRIRQMLINLLGNAIKFTQQGSVKLTVSRAPSNKGEMLTFAVSDTGIGIAEDILPQLFSEFTQADASISRKYEGTGLGLAISKKLAELLGGTITITSVLGEGSTFIATVPLLPLKDDAVASKRNVSKSTTFYRATRHLCVLVAEDNHMNQRIISSILNKYGHTFEIADNGAAAIDLHKNHHFDLILMDIRMPEMSGSEATQAIRSLAEDKSQIPIIALTADAVEENIKGYKNIGMDACVTKPIDQTLLLETINDVLGEAVHIPVTQDQRSSPRLPDPIPLSTESTSIQESAVADFLSELGLDGSSENKSS